MEIIFEILKAILFGIVEGITEWLPVSSTGHMILLDEFVHLNVSEAFYEMFQVVIQLGAILAVILLFFQKLNPFCPKKTQEQKNNTWQLWFKVVVAITLIVYGVAFIYMERQNTKRSMKVKNVYDIDYRTALLIGCFQCLSLIPGTSRSGSTILGAIILGVGRSAGAEFSFFLAIPTMLGASALKLLKFILSGVSAGGLEIAVLLIGCVVSFIVSVVVIRGLMEYVRKRSFAVFGVYRIVLGAFVLLYFLVKSLIG